MSFYKAKLTTLLPDRLKTMIFEEAKAQTYCFIDSSTVMGRIIQKNVFCLIRKEVYTTWDPSDQVFSDYRQSNENVNVLEQKFFCSSRWKI